jgi:hypothetical protein
MNQNIDESILFAEDSILDLTRDRLENRQKNSNDEDMPEYSSFSKSLKGLTYWNLLQTGDLFRKMFMVVKYPLYLINSKSSHSEKIQEKVPFDIKENFYAISPTDQPKAKQITVKAFAQKYKSYVFGK